MKVIFLDIDGVLNTYSTKEMVAGYTFVEDSLVQRLKELVAATGANLVLSSTWREGWNMLKHPEEYSHLSHADIRLFYALRDKLRECDMELMDYTPIFGLRGQEIDDWLTHHAPEPVEAFVILDDMYELEFEPHADHLVQTSMSTGLMPHHIEQAIAILNRGEA